MGMRYWGNCREGKVKSKRRRTDLEMRQGELGTVCKTTIRKQNGMIGHALDDIKSHLPA
jgi:hypothetical protein